MSEEESWSNTLFDRIIAVRFITVREDVETVYTEDEDAAGFETTRNENEYVIDIPANEHGGIKPDISLSVSLLPQEMFHEVTLTIKNYKMPFDIRKYKRMEITAGYRKQVNSGSEYDEMLIRRFPIEIFYSYCLTPAPDSVTVFKGIVVSTLGDSIDEYFSSNTEYTLTFFKNVSVIDFINEAVAAINAAGYNIGLKEYIQEEVKNCIMNTGPVDTESMPYGKVYTFNSVANIMRNISAMLESACRGSNIKGSYNVTFAEGCLVIYCTDGYYKKDEPVVHLDRISSATLNAGIMNVTAPWYPPLIPGNIIKVSREYIDGSDLPNVIDTYELMGVDNLYRILTMDVDFSTISGNNTMKITALPLKYADDKAWGVTKGKEEFEYKYKLMVAGAKQIQERLMGKKRQGKYLPRVSRSIGGETRETNAVFRYVEEHPDLFSGMKVRVSSPVEYDVTTIKLCTKVIYKDISEPLTYQEPNYTSLVSTFDNRWLWPLVYAATYKSYLDLRDDAARSGKTLEDVNNKYTLSPSTYGVILTGKCFAYPDIKSWDDLKNSKFSDLYKAASQLKTVPSGEKVILEEISKVLIA